MLVVNKQLLVDQVKDKVSVLRRYELYKDLYYRFNLRVDSTHVTLELSPNDTVIISQVPTAVNVMGSKLKWLNDIRLVSIGFLHDGVWVYLTISEYNDRMRRGWFVSGSDQTLGKLEPKEYPHVYPVQLRYSTNELIQNKIFKYICDVEKRDTDTFVLGHPIQVTFSLEGVPGGLVNFVRDARGNVGIYGLNKINPRLLSDQTKFRVTHYGVTEPMGRTLGDVYGVISRWARGNLSFGPSDNTRTTHAVLMDGVMEHIYLDVVDGIFNIHLPPRVHASPKDLTTIYNEFCNHVQVSSEDVVAGLTDTLRRQLQDSGMGGQVELLMRMSDTLVIYTTTPDLDELRFSITGDTVEVRGDHGEVSLNGWVLYDIRIRSILYPGGTRITFDT